MKMALLVAALTLVGVIGWIVPHGSSMEDPWSSKGASRLASKSHEAIQPQVKLPRDKGPIVQSFVNLNTGTLEDLATLPGIGPVLAQRIISYREKKGSFDSVEELQSVSGIGEKRLAKLRGWVTVQDKPRSAS